MPSLEHFLANREQLGQIAVVSPDVGNVKVANMFADLLECDLAIIDKRRHSGDEISVKNLIGDVNGCTVLMFDDLVSTAGTICEAARLVMDKGAKDVICAATHGVFVGMALERIQNSPISQLVVTDTISCEGRCEMIDDKLVELSAGKLLGEAIHRIHHDQSISAMFRTIIGTKR